MKTSTKLFMFAISLAGLSTAANAQSTATASTNATATLITPISIAGGVAMNFGTLVSSTTGGSVLLAFDGTLSPTGGVTILPGSTSTAGTFTVNGEGSNGFNIQIPTGPIALVGATLATNTLEVTNLVCDLGTSSTLVSGTRTITIGATLTVPAGAAADIYSNPTDLAVTVNYN